VWVCYNTIGGPGVQSSSGRSVPSTGYVLLCTGVNNRSFDFSLFLVNLGVVVLKPIVVQDQTLFPKAGDG